jgi:hypothetical protein
MAGALIMASAYVLSTPPISAAASIGTDEEACTDAVASNETCRADIPPGR